MAEDTSNLTQNRETFIATFSKCLQDGKTEAKMFFFPLIEVFTSGVGSRDSSTDEIML